MSASNDPTVFVPIPGKVYSAKELKRIYKPIFAAHPEKHYPKSIFEEFGFSRHTCPKCGTNYWRRTPERDTCGDSSCVGEYTFIDNGINKTNNKPCDSTQASVFESFKKSFTNTKPFEHTVVKRYPVVARWRDDCEFTAAGIQCYQPYCVTGEVEPPANPLIQAQFCLRFNDLDSIGLSGRHYSGFNMLGIQVFNSPEKFRYWHDIIRYNLNWLTDMGVPLDDVTLLEDVWAGGGNLGSCVEYFIRGLEVGNMVFTEFKANSNGTIEPLSVQVIDVGIGLERIPWLLNGTPTSYMTTFPTALKLFTDRVGDNIENLIHSESWKRFGRYSCLLNIDELDNEEGVEGAWKKVGELCHMDPNQMRADIDPVHDAYIVIDHLRSLMVAIQDGALPSNVGGGANLRNVLRRVFHILCNTHKGEGKDNSWFAKIGGVNGIVDLMNAHRIDLESIHGEGSFPEFKPLRDIINIEYERWCTTDKDAKSKMDKLIKKRGSVDKLTVEDWIVAVTTYGLSPDTIAYLYSTTVPTDFYCKMAEEQEKVGVTAKVAQVQQYDTTYINNPGTDCVYYDVDRKNPENIIELGENENIKVLKVFENRENDSPMKGKKNIVVLSKTCIYPCSGGQATDTGVMTVTDIDGKVETYNIIEGKRVGNCVLHFIDREFMDEEKVKKITLKIDADRRLQLMQHHTAAHIIHHSAREVLGPHVWQAGAKKSVDIASLDITHYRGLTFDEERAIERVANRCVRECIPITKTTYPKDIAEKKYGFGLYQGGVVPGNSVRCVVIGEGNVDEAIDAEACCGTHMSNTGNVGLIRVVKSIRISDGVVRIYFVAGEAAFNFTDTQSTVLNEEQEMWGVQLEDVVKTAQKFFNNSKKYENTIKSYASDLLQTRIEYVAAQSSQKLYVFDALEENASSYLSTLTSILNQENISAKLINENGELRNAIAFVGSNFVFIVASDNEVIEKAKTVLSEVTKDLKITSIKSAGKKAKKVIGQKELSGSQILATSIDNKQKIEKVKAGLRSIN